MKKYMLWIALTAFLLPIIARGLWFYRGIPTREPIATPDYASLSPKPAPFETPNGEDKNIKQTKGIVLLDAAHGNQYQQHELLSLREAIELRGGSVEVVSDTASLATRLKYASAYVVVAPSLAFTTDETRLIQSFTQRGGRLIVFTDATRGLVYSDFFTGSIINYSDAVAANSLLAGFGITVNNDYLYDVKTNDSNFRNVVFEEFAKNELTFGLKKVIFYGAHSLETNSGNILLKSAATTLSSIDDAHHPQTGAAALSADGSALALGDFTFLTSPYHNAADNADLIDNIADFALGGARKITLQNFPFVFAGSEVKVYATEDVILTAEAVDAISGVQTALNAMNISLTLAKEAPREGNLLILGKLAYNKEMEDYLVNFGIELDENEKFIEIPKLGKMGRYGNGLLLFEKGKTGNRLILLADTDSDLVSLLDVVASGALSNCLLQDNIGICSVSYGGSYESEPTPEPILEPLATPTAGG